MHDTVVDGEVGEIHRLYEDPETTAEEFSNELNIPKDELLKGLK